MYNDRKLSKNGCSSAGVDDSAVPMKLSRSSLGAAGWSIAIAMAEVEDDMLDLDDNDEIIPTSDGRRVGGSLRMFAIICLAY